MKRNKIRATGLEWLIVNRSDRTNVSIKYRTDRVIRGSGGRRVYRRNARPGKLLQVSSRNGFRTARASVATGRPFGRNTRTKSSRMARRKQRRRFGLQPTGLRHCLQSDLFNSLMMNTSRSSPRSSAKRGPRLRQSEPTETTFGLRSSGPSK